VIPPRGSVAEINGVEAVPPLRRGVRLIIVLSRRKKIIVKTRLMWNTIIVWKGSETNQNS
jgi:hypothetical protein